MIAAIFSQSTLLVHCNPWILLIISAVMDVYRNFPDFRMSGKSAGIRFKLCLHTHP